MAQMVCRDHLLALEVPRLTLAQCVVSYCHALGMHDIYPADRDHEEYQPDGNRDMAIRKTS